MEISSLQTLSGSETEEMEVDEGAGNLTVFFVIDSCNVMYIVFLFFIFREDCTFKGKCSKEERKRFRIQKIIR